MRTILCNQLVLQMQVLREKLTIHIACIIIINIMITVSPFFSASDTALVPPNPALFTLVMLKVYRGHQLCVTYWYPSLVVLMCVSVVPSSDETCIMYMRGTPASVYSRMLE